MSAEPPTDSLLPTRQSLLSRLRDWQDQRRLAPIFRELLAADLQCRSQVRAGQFGEQKPGSGVTADSHAFLPDNYAPLTLRSRLKRLARIRRPIAFAWSTGT
jgi:hypothetical protein